MIMIVFVCSQGPGWSYETDLPVWANVEWMEPE